MVQRRECECISRGMLMLDLAGRRPGGGAETEEAAPEDQSKMEADDWLRRPNEGNIEEKQEEDEQEEEEEEENKKKTRGTPQPWWSCRLLAE